jgi:hypothetical protein
VASSREVGALSSSRLTLAPGHPSLLILWSEMTVLRSISPVKSFPTIEIVVKGGWEPV